MKKLCLLLALVMLMSVCLIACGKKEEDDWEVVKNELGGFPTETFRFKELPENYTPDQAVREGCLVLQWDEGATTPRVRGIDYWETFLKTCRAKEKVSIRIVYFTAQNYWFSDLYYSHDVFSLYTRDTYSENQIGPYKYLTQIQGEDIYTGKPVNYFILTDDPELGSEEVLSLSHICDIEAERAVYFHTLDFTTYFN